MHTQIGPVGSLAPHQVRDVLHAATQAPSLHNSQPWRFRLTPDSIQLFADLDRALPAADPDHRELVLGCGAALMNLRLGIRALDVNTDVRLRPDPRQPTLLAVVRPHGHRRRTPLEERLTQAIPRRRTNRRQFTDRDIAEPIRHQLRHAAQLERAWLAILGPHQLPAMRQLVQHAHEVQLSDPQFQSEWLEWTAREPGGAEGVPLTSSGHLPEPHDDWVKRDFSGGQGRLRIPGNDFEPRPLIAVVGAFHDRLLGRLQAGQAMQRVLLTATVEGLSGSFISQAVEVPEARRELRELIGGALWPQTVLRLGYGSPVTGTPRRALDDVVMVDDRPEPSGLDPVLSHLENGYDGDLHR
jgi:nitroreductase